jgi:hypothetical protein
LRQPGFYSIGSRSFSLASRLTDFSHGVQPTKSDGQNFLEQKRNNRPKLLRDGRKPGVYVMIRIFGDFFANFRRKMAFFSKTNGMIQILPKLAEF